MNNFMSKVKFNVLLLTLIGSGLLIWLAHLFPSEGSNILIAAGGLIGLIGALGKELVAPEPNPSVPASVVHDILKQMKG